MASITQLVSRHIAEDAHRWSRRIDAVVSVIAIEGTARCELLLLRELIPAQHASVSIPIPADHPRLDDFVKRGIVRRAPPRAWGSEQTTGAPDTKGAGDIRTAWASKTQDGQEEWLELTYERAIKPVEIHVVETYNPGALFKVTAMTSSGMEAVMWRGDDPTPPDAPEGRGTSVVKVRAAVTTDRIRIHLASDKVSGWNEIDAVGIKDEAGKMHWAVSATASSEYASGETPGFVIEVADALNVIDELHDQLDKLRARVKQLEGKRSPRASEHKTQP